MTHEAEGGLEDGTFAIARSLVASLRQDGCRNGTEKVKSKQICCTHKASGRGLHPAQARQMLQVRGSSNVECCLECVCVRARARVRRVRVSGVNCDDSTALDGRVAGETMQAAVRVGKNRLANLDTQLASVCD